MEALSRPPGIPFPLCPQKAPRPKKGRSAVDDAVILCSDGCGVRPALPGGLGSFAGGQREPVGQQTVGVAVLPGGQPAHGVQIVGGVEVPVLQKFFQALVGEEGHIIPQTVGSLEQVIVIG